MSWNLLFVNLYLSWAFSVACILRHYYKFFKSVPRIAGLLFCDYPRRSASSWHAETWSYELSLSAWQKWVSFNGHLFTCGFPKVPQGTVLKVLEFSSALRSPLAARPPPWVQATPVLSTHFYGICLPLVEPPEHFNSPDSHTAKTKSAVKDFTENVETEEAQLWVLLAVLFGESLSLPPCGVSWQASGGRALTLLSSLRSPTGSFRRFCTWESGPNCFPCREKQDVSSS